MHATDTRNARLKARSGAEPRELDDEEYTSIWSALMETPRGRKFLSEFARRTRSSETRNLLEAVQTLEKALLDQQSASAKAEPGRATQARMKQRVGEAVEALGTVARILDRSIYDIRAAADRIQDTAWTLRDGGVRASLCESLEREVEEIHELASVQSIAGQRTAKTVHSLHGLVERVDGAGQEAADDTVHAARREHGDDERGARRHGRHERNHDDAHHEGSHRRGSHHGASRHDAPHRGLLHDEVGHHARHGSDSDRRHHAGRAHPGHHRDERENQPWHPRIPRIARDGIPGLSDHLDDEWQERLRS